MTKTQMHTHGTITSSTSTHQASTSITRMHISFAFLLCLFVALCTIALTGCTSNAASGAVPVEGSSAPAHGITVNATSEVKVVPDKAQIGVAVTSQAATAAETQTRNAEDINAVIEALKGLGVDEKSIQTTYTYLNPRYDYSNPVYYEEPLDTSTGTTADGEELAPAEGQDESSNIVGYEMTTSLTIKDLEIDEVGKILQACVAAGANNTDGIQYYSSEYDTKYAEALEAAVGNARTKAEVLAKASGVNLGGVSNITEGYQNMAYRYDTGANMTMEAAAEEADSLKVSPGEINIEASVTVSYEIS